MATLANNFSLCCSLTWSCDLWSCNWAFSKVTKECSSCSSLLTRSSSRFAKANWAASSVAAVSAATLLASAAWTCAICGGDASTITMEFTITYFLLASFSFYQNWTCYIFNGNKHLHRLQPSSFQQLTEKDPNPEVFPGSSRLNQTLRMLIVRLWSCAAYQVLFCWQLLPTIATIKHPCRSKKNQQYW